MLHKLQLKVLWFRIISPNRNFVILVSTIFSDILMIFGRVVHKVEKACHTKEAQL